MRWHWNTANRRSKALGSRVTLTFRSSAPVILVSVITILAAFDPQSYPAARRSRCSRASGAESAMECASTRRDRKSTRLNSSHGYISYAVFCLKKKYSYYVDHVELS